MKISGINPKGCSKTAQKIAGQYLSAISCNEEVYNNAKSICCCKGNKRNGAMKYEECENDTTPFDQYPNVIPKSWWPQTDLLGDDRLKAFITHAGMNSMLEVTFRGKPAITVPLFADWYINVKASASIGMSTMVKRTELNQKNLIVALHKVLDSDSEITKKERMAGVVLQGKGEEYRKEAL